MDKKLIAVCLLVVAFFFSGGGLLLIGVGIMGSLGGLMNIASDEGSQGTGGGAPPGTVCDPGGETIKEEVPGRGVYEVGPEQMRNAAVIVKVGEDKKLPDKGLVIAIMTALQESNLYNLDYGDRDSLGLFQQRPSAGWGTPEQVTNPTYSAKAFYGGPQPPSPPGLVDIRGWEKMPNGVAAQAVQVSAFPDEYAKWESIAGKIVGRAKDIECSEVGVGGDLGKVIKAAKDQLGVWYCWGGGDANGPTYTKDCPSGVKEGFDCSGLTLYAYAQVGITLGHYTGLQWNAGERVRNYEQLKPGDLMYFSDDGSEAGIHHVSMYLGNDEMIHAPRTGKQVEIVQQVSKNPYWNGQFVGGTRHIQDDGGGGDKDERAAAERLSPAAVPVALREPAPAVRAGGRRGVRRIPAGRRGPRGTAA